MIEAAFSSYIYATRSNFHRLHPPYVRINTAITRRFGSTADTFCRPPLGIVLCALHGHAATTSAYPQQQQRIFAVSDIHTDAYKENLEWCQRLHPQEFSKDVLLVAGDVSDDFGTLEQTLSILMDRFGAVFYCPGNHEVWIRSFDRENGIATSWDKLRKVFDLCARLGVRTTPQRLHNTWICPIMSWHHRSFDEEPDVPGVPRAGLMTIADYAACDWSLPFTRQNASLEAYPTEDGNGHVDVHQEHQRMRWNNVSDDVSADIGRPGSLELAEWWDELNDGPVWDAFLTDIATNSRDVITFSHFAPYQHCLPEKRFLFYANLAKAAGSVPLGRRVKSVKPAVHVFGHSHFAWDLTVGGTRFIQAPLCSPSERLRRLRTIAFDAFGEEASARPVEANWLPLEIYRFNPDTPEISFGSDNAVHATAKHQAQPLQGTTTAAARTATATATAALSHDQVPRRGDATRNGRSVVTKKDGTIVGNRRCGDHDDDLTTCNEAVHGASTRLCDDPLPLKNHISIQSLPSTPSSGRLSQQIEPQRSAVGERGIAARVQLNHGSCPGPLGAHWSMYYAKTARTPEDVTMAPWVARAYRHRKRKKKGGGSDASSSASNSD